MGRPHHRARSPKPCAPGATNRWPGCCVPAPTSSTRCRTTSRSSPPGPGPGPPWSARWSIWTGSRCRPPRRWRLAPDPAPYDTLALAPHRRRAGRTASKRDDAGATVTRRAAGRAGDAAGTGPGRGEDEPASAGADGPRAAGPVPAAPLPHGPGAHGRGGDGRDVAGPASRRSWRRRACRPRTTRSRRWRRWSALFTDRTRMAELLDTAPVEALSVLDRLVWGPPYGEVTPNPTPPVKWLRDRGLCCCRCRRGRWSCRVERRCNLRAGRAHRVPEPVPPVVTAAAERDPQAVDRAAAGQAVHRPGDDRGAAEALERRRPADPARGRAERTGS